MGMLEATVGRGGRNLVHDVAALQVAFSALRGPDHRPLWQGPVDGAWQRHRAALEAAIETFQRAHHIASNARIDPVSPTQGRLELSLPASHRGLRGLAGTAAVYRMGHVVDRTPAPAALPKAERTALEGVIAQWRRAPGLPMTLSGVEVTSEGRFKAVLVARGVEWFDAGARRFDGRAPIPDPVRQALVAAPTGNAHWRAVVRAGAHASFDLVSARAVASLQGPPRLDLDALQRFRITVPPDDAAARACIAGCARLFADGPSSAGKRDLDVLLEALDAAASDAAKAIRLASSELENPGIVGQSPQNRGTGRPLTPGEVALARSIFGAAINYDVVHLHPREYSGAFGAQPDRDLMVVGSDIYFGSDVRFVTDFSNASLPMQAVFVHEMTHVWQAQNRQNIAAAIVEHVTEEYPYAYLPLQPGKTFVEYDIEEQAAIVEGYFRLTRGLPILAKHNPSNARIPTIDTYRRLIPFVPDQWFP